MQRWILMYAATACVFITGGVLASAGETGALPADRLSQEQIASGAYSRNEIRRQGLVMFSTPFNRLDGYGDGPTGRPTMGGNGMFLRVNGLDAQSCLECHSIVRASTMPPLLGIGGVGGSASNAIVAPSQLSAGEDGAGTNIFDGRFANPPFLFGAGGVELLALEMTADLQRLKARAVANPGTSIELESKGVHFGFLTANAAGELDTTNVTGVKDDLVVRPFGRKGEFSTVRAFDLGALQFHFGMQPIESVGRDVDADGDGVPNEATRGDLSALHVFATTLDRPIQDRRSPAAKRGRARFESIGCIECHRPSLETRARRLPLRLPEVETDPQANIYGGVDLTKAAPGFKPNRRGGLTVPLFSDLRRHDMGEGLKENFHQADDEENRTFVTARLWGIADSAPYLHDGRATTLTDAILAHGGEAEPVRDRFEALSDAQRDEVLAFLRTLRTPERPARDLLDWMKRGDAKAKKSKKAARPKKHDWRAVTRKRKKATWWPRFFKQLGAG